MSDRQSRLRRLADAVDVFLAQRDQPVGARDAVLQQHDALRDLLEPMFAHATTAPARDGFGDFRIVHEIGRGGMGVVYEAEEVALRRRVALKVLPPHFGSSARSVERFHREAGAIAMRHADAEPALRAAIELREALCTEFPEQQGHRLALSNGLSQLALAMTFLNRRQEAMTAITRARAISWAN